MREMPVFNPPIPVAPPPPPPPTEPTVRVDVHTHQGLDVIISVTAPRVMPAIAATVNALGMAAVAAKVEEQVTESDEYHRWVTYHEQVRAAEDAVKTAERAAGDVDAARTLLLRRPEMDLANKIRDMEVVLEGARAAATAAAADLELIRGSAAHAWVPLANRISSAIVMAVGLQYGPIADAEAEARENLKAGVDAVRAILDAAVREHILGAGAAVIGVGRASRSLGAFIEEGQKMVDRLAGPPPDGVKGVGHGHWRVEAPADPKPPEPPRMPPEQVSGGGRVY